MSISRNFSVDAPKAAATAPCPHVSASRRLGVSASRDDTDHSWMSYSAATLFCRKGQSNTQLKFDQLCP